MKITDAQIKIINSLGKNVSQSEIAKALGLDRSSISVKIKRNKELTIDEIVKLESYFNICLQNSTSVNGEQLYYLPMCGDIAASLGMGKEIFSEEVTSRFCLPRSLFKQIGANPDTCCIINTDGASMYPTIIGGQDLIMVDTSQIEIFDGKIYLIRIENSLFAKRLQKLPKNNLKIISDNPAYDSYVLNLEDETLNFKVIGRIVWISRPC